MAWSPSFLRLFALLVVTALQTTVPATDPIVVNSLPYARNLHGSAVVGDLLFVIGGDTPHGFTRAVQSARIRPDRSLGVWFENTALPENLIYIGSSVATVGNNLYVCGGQAVEEGSTRENYVRRPSNKVYCSTLRSDGSLTPWRASNPWPSPSCVGMAAATDGRSLYLLGGGVIDAEIPWPVVYRARINSNDGSLGDWSILDPMPEPVWFHHATVHDGRLYVIGGLTGATAGSATDRVLRTTIREDGTLGPWERDAARLFYAVSAAASASDGQYLFLIGGQTQGGAPLAQIQFASLGASGLSPWRNLESSPAYRQFAAAACSPAVGGLYVTGGRTSADYVEPTSDALCFPLLTGSRATNIAAATPRPRSFLSYPEASATATDEGKGLFVFFYAENHELSRTLRDSLAQSTGFFEHHDGTIPAAVEITEHKDLARQYNIIRVPACVVTDARGTPIRAGSGMLTREEIESFVNAN